MRLQKMFLVGIWTTVASAASFTLDATASGFYTQTGATQSGNYAVGWYNGFAAEELRDYFLFDLTGITGTITGATLKLQNINALGNVMSLGADPNETLAIFDVSTALASLSNGSGGIAAYTDLGSGTSFGSVVHGRFDATPVEVVFNVQGLAYLNSNLGAVGFGGALTSLTKGQGAEALFNSSNGTMMRQLIVTTADANDVPEPSAALLGLLGLLPLFWLLRKKKP